MVFVTTTEPGQVAQEKNGEQAPSSLCLSWLLVLLGWSAQQSSTPQQGINVPAATTRINIVANHFFTSCEGKL